MINLLQQIDFSKQLQQQRQLSAYIRQAAQQIQKSNSQQLSKFIKPIFDEDLENHLIVTNIPDLKTPQKQKAFLIMFSTNVLDKKAIGEKQGLVSIQPGYLELNGQRKYNGTLYMIYKTPTIAKRAYQKLHRYKLSKENTLHCFTVKQFRDVQKINKQYKQPKLFLKKQLVSHNFDEKFRDQFIYINKENSSSKINIKWFDYIQKKIDDVFSGDDTKPGIPLSEEVRNIVFSSKGNYLAICQSQGVSLLAGEKLSQKGFYSHEGVTQVVFSPNQTYMISYNKNSSKAHSQECFKIWAVQSQVLLTQYKAQPHQSLSSFQFNNDQTKLAIILNNQFVVFQSNNLENFKNNIKMSQEQLVNSGKLIKALNLQKITWLPDYVSVTCVCYELNPQINTHPTSKIFTYNTLTKEEKKWKAIGQNIRNVQIAISDNAEWIGISFDKVQKKVASSVIYIVNLRKRQIQTQVVQFKQNVVSISWDKRNNIFGVVTELPTVHKNQDAKCAVYFYQIITKDKIQQAVKFDEIPVTPTNRIIIAQNGTFFALYNISSLTWGKYKYSIGSFSRDPKTKKLAIDMIKENLQIPYMTYFNMDETGRFILTGTDKTFQIWTTAGELISKDMFSTQIKHVQFRPRESVRLNQEEEARLQERQKQIKKKYEQQDEKRMSRIKDEQKLQRQRKCDEFRKFLQQKRKWFSEYRQFRTNLLGFNEEDPKVRSSVYQIEYVQRNN